MKVLVECFTTFIFFITVNSLIAFEFSEVNYQLINDLIKKTFPELNCLNLYMSREIHEYYDVKYLHNTAFTFLNIDSFEKTNQYCGYVYLCKSFSELNYLKNVNFDIIPRILFVAMEKTIDIPEIHKKNTEVFRDKDFVILDLSTETNVYKQSRHFLKLENVDMNTSEHLFLPAYQPQTAIDYKQRITRVVTFHCPAFGSIKDDKKQDLGDGVETRIFKEIVKKLNLKSKVIVPSDGKRWGTAYTNGTISGGILKYLHTKQADIGFCSLWIETSKFRYIVMSGYWNILCLRFLVPKPKIMSSHWGTIFRPLPFHLWILIFLSTIATTAICSALHHIQRIINPNYFEKTTTISSFISMIGTLVMTKNPNKYENSNPTKHLFLWWSIFALIITSLYSSSLVSHLTYPQHYPMIDTIEGLVRSGHYWGTPYEPPKKYVFDYNNTWHKIFANRFKYEINADDRVKRILSGNYSVFSKCIGNEHFMEVHDVPDSILHELRAPRHCLNYFYLGFGFRKALPYADAADRIIATLVESGITEYWLNRVFEKEYSPTTFAKVYEYKTPPEDVQLKSLTIDNLQSVFFVLLAGALLSAITFIGEIFNVKFSNVKLTP